MTYDGAPAGAAAGSSAVLGLGRTAPRHWLGLSAAMPLSDDPFWAVLGGWQRFAGRGTSGPLLDVSANGFIQREHATVRGAPALAGAVALSVADARAAPHGSVGTRRGRRG